MIKIAANPHKYKTLGEFFIDTINLYNLNFKILNGK